MEISLRHIGGSATRPSDFIEVTVSDGSTTLTVDVTDKGMVDQTFITNLEDVLEELKEQNRLIEELKA